ncbi:hypothetical protein B7R54_10010 [Subtercola boreus]|uniref:NADH-ubiquinone oxidoreductase 51kDa subunit iron-sulphur binding domain-containing protein n=1 Tax=Subtercola boreus TaxID=120213 RepID=A0A3E0VIP0_9MICO|nr:NADH-ubiquinone oxidoreductase-F iron-sulfur binding region domain-containing protein [Subtercola boreus]RFA09519.1 hypothetical protein B7R54_10010 [Subtercola boreus]TQL53420.1 NADH dehydrogenase subunit F [Subtercola boreus]
MTLTAPVPSPPGNPGSTPARPPGPAGPQGTARLFLARTAGLADHRAAYGEFPLVPADALIEQLRLADLVGRGGAGFPVWRKLDATRDKAPHRKTTRDPSKRPVVIGNGSEGEPLSRKDETLLSRSPHLIIDGLLLAAAAVGASALHLCVSAGTRQPLEAALAERPDAGQVRVLVVPDAFVSGEATAVANAVEHGVSVPRDHTLHLSESGVGRRPTLVQNVETLAQLALIARFGADWYRSVGTPDEPGTRLVTVSGDVGAPQVLEVAGGTPLSSILAAAGAAPGSLRAVLIGGYHGTWLGSEHLGTPFSRDGLRMLGAAPGAGILIALSAARCGLEVSAGIADYLAAQTAGQCGPCVNGLPALAGMLARLSRRERDPRLPAEVARLAGLVDGRGSCAHPDGTARFVISTLSAFEGDVRAHLSGVCEVSHGRA